MCAQWLWQASQSWSGSGHVVPGCTVSGHLSEMARAGPRLGGGVFLSLYFWCQQLLPNLSLSALYISPLKREYLAFFSVTCVLQCLEKLLCFGKEMKSFSLLWWFKTFILNFHEKKKIHWCCFFVILWIYYLKCKIKISEIYSSNRSTYMKVKPDYTEHR